MKENKIDFNNVPKVLPHDIKDVVLGIFAHIYNESKKEDYFNRDGSVIKNCVVLKVSWFHLFFAMNKVFEDKKLKILFNDGYIPVDIEVDPSPRFVNIDYNNCFSGAIALLQDRYKKYEEYKIAFNHDQSSNRIVISEMLLNNYLIKLRMGLFSVEEDKLIEECAKIFMKEFGKADKILKGKK